jgi:hypothetical protein
LLINDDQFSPACAAHVTSALSSNGIFLCFVLVVKFKQRHQTSTAKSPPFTHYSVKQTVIRPVLLAPSIPYFVNMCCNVAKLTKVTQLLVTSFRFFTAYLMPSHIMPVSTLRINSQVMDRSHHTKTIHLLIVKICYILLLLLLLLLLLMYQVTNDLYMPNMPVSSSHFSCLSSWKPDHLIPHDPYCTLQIPASVFRFAPLYFGPSRCVFPVHPAWHRRTRTTPITLSHHIRPSSANTRFGSPEMHHIGPVLNLCSQSLEPSSTLYPALRTTHHACMSLSHVVGKR